MSAQPTANSIALKPDTTDPALDPGVSRVFARSLESGSYEELFRRGLEFIGVLNRIRRSDRVAIKPNLTYPQPRRGVTTSVDAIESLIRILKERTDRIYVCESDSGGYNPFSMESVFRETGLNDVAQKYGVKLVNLSHEPSRTIDADTPFGKIAVPLPTLLLDETDFFFSMPVPKIHMNTGVSIALKNQWGVIQKPSARLKLHPRFKEVIYAINRALPRPIAIVDGKYGLTRSGPMVGDVVDLNWILVSNDVYCADFHSLRLMGIDYKRIKYLRYIFTKEGLARVTAPECDIKVKPAQSGAFYLKRAWTDYPGLLAFKSRSLAYVAYESPLAETLHRLLYLFRKRFY